jgi:ParB family chromosome partitioning protein
VRQTEKLVQGSIKEREADRKQKYVDPFLSNVTERLKRVLGTQIKIIDRNGKGKIEIEYYSLDDLERIIESLMTRG